MHEQDIALLLLTTDFMSGVDVMGIAKLGTIRCAAKTCGTWRQVSTADMQYRVFLTVKLHHKNIQMYKKLHIE